ncbi:MAG: pyrroloquinoline quinone biosynthesis peptide chaperone PqqD [Gemmobacter sp.]
MTPGAIATLPRGVRLHWDRVRLTHVLLAPERALMLDEVGHAILSRLDGRTYGALVEGLAADFGAPAADVGPDVTEFLGGLVRERLVDLTDG